MSKEDKGFPATSGSEDKENCPSLKNTGNLNGRPPLSLGLIEKGILGNSKGGGSLIPNTPKGGKREGKLGSESAELPPMMIMSPTTSNANEILHPVCSASPRAFLPSPR